MLDKIACENNNKNEKMWIECIEDNNKPNCVLLEVHWPMNQTKTQG